MDRYAHILNRNGINKIHDKLKKTGHPYLPEYSDDLAEKIINVICDHYKTNVEDVTKSRSRLRQVIMSKYIAMYIIHCDYPHLRDHMVSRLFNLDRTTFIYAVRKVKDLIDFDKLVRDDYQVMRKKVNGLYKC